MNFDLPTLGFMVGLASLTSGIALLWLSYGQKVDGLFAWGMGLFVMALSLPLISMQGSGMIPDSLCIIGGNTLLSASISILLVAVWRFQRRQVNLWLAMAPVVLTLLLFSFSLDDRPARILWGGLILAFQCTLVGYALWQQRQVSTGRAQSLIICIAALITLVLIARSLILLAPGFDFLLTDHVNQIVAISFIIAMMVILLIAIGFISMIREQADARNLELALHDELTGIPNRRAILEMLEKSFAEAGRTDSPLSLLMLDIDHFKRINDHYGHQGGDQLLQNLTRLLNARLRAQDSLGRYGGEEFIVLLPNTSLAAARKLADELRILVQDSPLECAGSFLQLTVSIGIASSRQSGIDTTTELIRCADAALYKAKNSGRNRCETETPAPLQTDLRAPEEAI